MLILAMQSDKIDSGMLNSILCNEAYEGGLNYWQLEAAFITLKELQY